MYEHPTQDPPPQTGSLRRRAFAALDAAQGSQEDRQREHERQQALRRREAFRALLTPLGLAHRRPIGEQLDCGDGILIRYDEDRQPDGPRPHLHVGVRCPRCEVVLWSALREVGTLITLAEEVERLERAHSEDCASQDITGGRVFVVE